MTGANDAGQKQVQVRPKIGLVGLDELRIKGLEGLLAGPDGLDLFPLSAPHALDTAGLELVLIDSAATEHLFQLMAAFRRSRPQLRLLVLGTETDMAYVEKIIDAGAKGYLTHKATAEEVSLAIAVVRDGSIWAPRKVLSRLLDRAHGRNTPEEPNSIHFTAREVEVLRLLVLGHPNREIAQALGVDASTVKAHLGRLMRKAGVDNRTALTMRAIERRWT